MEISLRSPFRYLWLQNLIPSAVTVKSHKIELGIVNMGDFFLRFWQGARMGRAGCRQVGRNHRALEQPREAPLEGAISSPTTTTRPVPPRSRRERVLLSLRRAIARRITSLPRRDRSRTRWRISGGWCGSGSATPSLCSPKFKRGSRYVSCGRQLQSQALAVDTSKIWALMLDKLFVARKF